MAVKVLKVKSFHQLVPPCTPCSSHPAITLHPSPGLVAVVRPKRVLQHQPPTCLHLHSNRLDLQAFPAPTPMHPEPRSETRAASRRLPSPGRVSPYTHLHCPAKSWPGQLF